MHIIPVIFYSSSSSLILRTKTMFYFFTILSILVLFSSQGSAQENGGFDELDRLRVVQLKRELIQEANPDGSSENYIVNFLNSTQDAVLLNWIKYFEDDIKEAKGHLKKSIEWRRKNKFESILSWDVPSFLEKHLNSKIVGYTIQGYPVVYSQIGEWKFKEAIKNGLQDDIVRFMVNFLESTIKTANNPEINPKAASSSIGKILFISDFSNFSVREFTNIKAINLVGTMGMLFETHFPFIADNIYLVNTPPLFKKSTAAFSNVLKAKTFSSIKIFQQGNKDWEVEVLSKLSSGSLP